LARSAMVLAWREAPSMSHPLDSPSRSPTPTVDKLWTIKLFAGNQAGRLRLLPADDLLRSTNPKL
jgi:hypothetical protein